MEEETPEKTWSERYKIWPANRLSFTYPENDVPGLLRGLADALDEVGPVEIQDITFAATIGTDPPEAMMTVYLQLPDPDANPVLGSPRG